MDPNTEAAPAAETDIIAVAIAKGGATLDVDVNAIPDKVYRMIVAEGLKAMLNKRMSKVGSVTKLVGAEKDKANAAAMTIAAENLAELLKGNVKGGPKANKVAAAVMTEARRLARIVVKDALRAAGTKISMVEASQITAAANALIESDKSILAQAERNIEARKVKTETDAEKLKAVLALAPVAESPKLLAAAEKRKADRAAALSAKQAGKVAPRARTERGH